MLLVDSRTFDYLKEETVFPSLAIKFPSKLRFLVTEPPESLLDGCLYKYIQFPVSTDCVLYCDIDVLPVNSLQPLFDRKLAPGLYLHIEGQLQNPDYGSDLEKEELELLGPEKPGFSAGKFLLVGQQILESFHTTMKEVLSKPNECWKSYYTLEQPLFNRVIYTLYTQGVPIEVSFFSEPTLLCNTHEESENTVFLDLCGDPGNGMVHLSKILNTYISRQLTA